MNCTIIEIPCDQTTALPVFHQEIEGEKFDEKIDIVAQRLAIERVQDGVSGAIRRRAGPQRLFLAIFQRHPAKGTLKQLAVFHARKRHPEMLQLVHGFGRMAAEVFDRVLVSKPVGTLDGIVHVPAPVVFAHIPEGSRDSALRGYGMTAGRKYLRQAGDFEAVLRCFESGAQTGATGSRDNDIVCVIRNRIGRHINAPRAPSGSARNRRRSQ